jgi:hypothetical protein
LFNFSSGKGCVFWNFECQEKIARYNVDLIGVQEIRLGRGGDERQCSYTFGGEDRVIVFTCGIRSMG